MNKQELNKNFLNDVEKFIGRSLNKKEDLTILLNLYFQKKELKEFEDIAFLGKYINGLFRVLQSSGKVNEFNYIDQVKKDFEVNVEKLTSQLQEISLTLGNDDKNKIEENYLRLAKESFLNIKQLAEDLDHIKKYLNHLKRN